ncbi:hypothetical protein AVEN_214301-1 [Araneus ventricosus]|uniref:Uncharacterized protein n=1 Tax=Araneus ventricosus TaxID=182803 RepID=A0A4Y2J727_ARAVE|nr:hypothetical protein AVEN_214301-1 [Araneus ventricosus]
MLETVIPVLSKLSIDEPNKWFHHVPAVQRTLNSTTNRATQKTPVEFLTGVPMKYKEDTQILQNFEEEYERSFQEQWELMREQSEEDILEIQEENCHSFNRKTETTTYLQNRKCRAYPTNSIWCKPKVKS